MKGSLVLISVILLFIIAFSSVNASQMKTVQVSPLSTELLIFNLNNGDKFTGSLSISGGGGNDIDFWVTDPQGTTILGLGRVSQGKTFEFTAQTSGAYTLHFGNTFSLLSSKTVTLSYDVSKPILSGGGVDFSSLLIIIVVIIIVIGIVGLAVWLSRKKSTPRTGQPPPPPPSNPLRL